MSPPALFVIGPGPIQRTVVELCPVEAYHVVGFAAAASALSQPLCSDPDLLIVQTDRLSVEALRERWPGVPILLIASRPAFDSGELADHLHPCILRREPVSALDLRLTIQRATAEHVIRQEVERTRSRLFREHSFTNLVGRKGSIANVVELAAVAARKDLNVLIHGEPGTGKRLLAKAVHFSGVRRNGPFVAVYCGAPPERLEAEIFGGEPGVGVGKAKLAHRGTLFLDEIGRTPVRLQEKLLRLIEKRNAAALDGALDVRVIVSATRDLPAMIIDGSFREDLFYRGKFVVLELPPLRDRLEDIPALASVFLKRSRQKHNRPGACLSEAVLGRFYGYSWPGNLAELAGAIDLAVGMATHDGIRVSDLPAALQVEETVVAGLGLSIPYGGLSLDGLEKQLIVAALERHNGNQTWAAKALGLTRKTLIYRMEKYGAEAGMPRAEATAAGSGAPPRIA